MLLPMLVGALLNASGVMVIELPEWLLAIAYMAIGWQIGLGFDKQIFLMALRPLPQILLSIFSLMAICAGMAGDWRITCRLIFSLPIWRPVQVAWILSR